MDDDCSRASVALVTGAGGGLGEECCAALAASGLHVMVADVDDKRADDVAATLRAAGRTAHSVAVDVRDRTAVEDLIAAAVSEHDGIAVLVNLAGALRNQVLVKIDDADFDLVLDTHLRGTLNTMRAVVPAMRAKGCGRIVNMSSVAVRGSIAGSAYGAAKGGIEALTRSVALEVAKHGITVNCVAPGLVDAGMFLTVDPDYKDEVSGRIPMRRLGAAIEVAACIDFLASPAASYVTGQTLRICGGLSLGL